MLFFHSINIPVIKTSINIIKNVFHKYLRDKLKECGVARINTISTSKIKKSSIIMKN